VTNTEHLTALAKVHVRLLHLKALNKEIRDAFHAEEWDIASNLMREYATESAQTFTQFEAAFEPSKEPRRLAATKRRMAF